MNKFKSGGVLKFFSSWRVKLFLSVTNTFEEYAYFQKILTSTKKVMKMSKKTTFPVKCQLKLYVKDWAISYCKKWR